MKFYEIVLYNVPPEIEDIETRLKRQYNTVISARRILKFPDYTPTTLVRVRTSSFECKREFLVRGCIVGDSWYRAQLSRTRRNPRRCYHCQEISFHLARNCPNDRRCMKCAGTHYYGNCRSPNEKCANCGEFHSSNSTLCSHWINQSQHRGKRVEWVNYDQSLSSHLKEIQLILNDQFCSINQEISYIREDITELKSVIGTMTMNLAGCRMDPPKSPQMTWDDNDIGHNADQLSANDLDPADGRNNSILTPSNSQDSLQPELDNTPEYDSYDYVSRLCSPPRGSVSSAFVQPRPEPVNVVNSEILKTKNSVHSEIITETGNCTALPSDTESMNVDATNIVDNPVRPKKPSDRYDPYSDPTYADFIARINRLTEAQVIDFQNQYNPYMGEVLFRYSSGTICKGISVLSVDGALNNIRPCEASIKLVNKLPTEEILCCPFHHLASEIRDTVDKTDVMNSLSRWRTKDVSRYCMNWQDSFYKYMEEQYGKVII